MEGIKFANPEYFYGLIIIPLLLAWYIFRQKKQYSSMTVSTSQGFTGMKPSVRIRLRHLLIALRLIAIALFIVALARPQTSASSKSVKTEGIDIVIALDVSTSMLAEDFKPNRIDAAKKTAIRFIDERVNDRIGLVIFSGESYTQCPVTIDHDVIKNLMSSVKSGMITDGTAIGMGLATAVSRLKDSKAKSKVIILLTDGINNMGNVAPLTAAEIASTFGIRVYTIGVGTLGKAPYPQKFRTWSGQIITQYVNVDVEIDEGLLRSIADGTGGKYFRAANNKALEKIYTEIDKLEKTRIDVAYFSRHTEEFLPWAIAGVLVFMLELILKFTVFRRLT